MKVCPKCGSRFSAESRFCECDGQLLIDDPVSSSCTEGRSSGDISPTSPMVRSDHRQFSKLEVAWGILLVVALAFCYWIYLDVSSSAIQRQDDLKSMFSDFHAGKYKSEIEEVKYADGTTKYVKKFYVTSGELKRGGWEQGDYEAKRLCGEELYGSLWTSKAYYYKNCLILTWLGIMSVAIWSLPFVIVILIRFFCKADCKRLTVCARWVSVVWCVIFFLPSVLIAIMSFEDKHSYQFLLLMISLLTCIIPVGLIRNGVKGVANR